MFRESGSGQDVSEVSGNVPLEKRISLTARNPSSLVIDRLCDQAREEGPAVAWLYCDYNAQQEQSVTNIIGAVLKQLVGRGGIPEEIPEELGVAFRERRRPLLADLMRMLRIAIASLPHVFICIDALDECLPRNLPQLFELLSDIVWKSPGARIFLTGRPHVKHVIHRYFAKAVVIPISPSHVDIRNFLEMKLERDDQPEAMNNDLREDILRIIPEKIPDMCVRAFGVSVL